MMTTTDFKQVLPLPPGSFGLPIIGETMNYLRDPQFAEKRQNQYGQIFKTHLFGRPTLVMIGSEANRFLFTNENKYFSLNWPRSAKALLGPASIGVQTGDEHQKRRKMLSQAFQSRALTGYISTIESITRIHMHKWERMGTLTLHSSIRKYALDVACKLFMGIDTTTDNHVGELFETWFGGILSIPVRLPWTKYARALHSREQLLEYIEQIVFKRQQQLVSNQDVLGILLQAQDEDGNKLSLPEIKDHLLTLLAGGHETVTSALTSLCLLLAQHPEVLAAARAEQQQLAFEGPLNLEHLRQMNYLEQVLKEVLRVIPPSSGGFREVIQSCEFNGYFIPQGWTILYEVVRTHQDSSVYTQPERFDPQRFSPERAEDKQKPFCYASFGGGVRECLGKELGKLEMKLFAALLLREYEWELLPRQNLDMDMLPVAHPRNAVKVKFRRCVNHV